LGCSFLGRARYPDDHTSPVPSESEAGDSEKTLGAQVIMARSFLQFAVAVLLFHGYLYAQNAEISGFVKDPGGAVIPHADVTLRNTATNTQQSTTTSEGGEYVLPLLKPGNYSLSAEAPGFAKKVIDDIRLEVAAKVSRTITLEVGSTTETVTVNGNELNVNTVDASVSTVVDRQFVENMPLNGRSFQSLMTLVPGVSVVPTSYAGVAGEIAVNGQRTEANYFTVDGVSANSGSAPYSPGFSAGYGGAVAGETALGTTQSMISVDALQEFRTTTSTYSAEYGRSPGGQFTFSSRSGTNEWHGSGFDYLRNDAFDANNWFNNNLGVGRQAERQNDFGGTLGGPLTIPGLYDGSNKTFFFFSYEGLRLTQPQAAQRYLVPGEALRASAPTATQPYLDVFPLPNAGDAGNGYGWFVAGTVLPSSLDSVGIRIDHSFSDRFKVFGRFNNAPSSSAQSLTNSGNPANVTTRLTNVKTLTLGATSILNPRVSNDARFNFTWNSSESQFALTNLGGATPLALTDIPGLTSSDWFFACVDNEEVYGCYRLAPQTDRQRQWNLVDTLGVTVGRHTLKLGVDFRRTYTHTVLPTTYELPQFSSVEEIQQGRPSFLVDYHSQGPAQPVYLNYSAFLQDEWRISPRLSASLGVRWELNPAPHDAGGNGPYGIDTLNQATMAVTPRGTPLWKTTYTNFAPRVGIAYQLNTSDRWQTVLRAGAGLFYDTGSAQASSGYLFGVGITSRTSFAGSLLPLTAEQLASVPAPSAAMPYNSEVVGFDPNLKLPRTWQWNTAIEQRLGSKQSLTLTYVGSAGSRLLVQKAYDPTVLGNTNFASKAEDGLGLLLTTNGASSNYNSLQVQFKRNLSHGLQALLSYTWSHALDDVTSNFQVYEQERASSDYDIRHNFQAALTYDIPARYSHRVLSAVLSHWSLDGRISARSALPLDIQGDTVTDPSGILLTYHPNLVAGQPVYLNGSEYPGGRAVNFAAFSGATDSAGNTVEGNLGRNALRGFDAIQADVAARRDFSLGERFKLQFRAEAFNVLNHPVYGSIYNILSYGPQLFGQAYTTQNNQLGGLNALYQVGGPRSLQLALKLHF
jgi:hypothetical protein